MKCALIFFLLILKKKKKMYRYASNSTTTGLVRVIDAINVAPKTSGYDSGIRHSSSFITSGQAQKTIEFPEADFSTVTAGSLLEASLSTLHPNKIATTLNVDGGEWVVKPSLCVSAASIGGEGDGFNEHRNNPTSDAFFLPLRASLLASGLTPSSGVACEIYLVGQWRSFNLLNNNNDDYNKASNYSSASTSNASTPMVYNNNNNSNNTSINTQNPVLSVFHPTKVLVTLWNVTDRPTYEIDLRRPLSEITLPKFKRVVLKLSGPCLEESKMEILVDGNLVSDDKDTKKSLLFPYIFDPSVIPTVIVRTKDSLGNNQNRAATTTTAGGSDSLNYYFSPTRAKTTQSRIEAEFSSSTQNQTQQIIGVGAVSKNSISNNPIISNSSSSTANNNIISTSSMAMSPLPKSHGGEKDLLQVAPENSKDWDSWFASRRQAREHHVRNQLAPSSREQLEVERALQVKSTDDVRSVIKAASAELASSSQILHQQLENVRSQIMRERMGDVNFAKVEGNRGLLDVKAVKTSVATDGVNKEPLVVNFR